MFKNIVKNVKNKIYSKNLTTNLFWTPLTNNAKFLLSTEKIAKFNFSQNSKEWLNRHNNDQFVKKSKIYDYRSRASFKLLEINQKYKILRAGTRVLDVGSAPGGWSQIAAELIKPGVNNANIVAVDILKMEPLSGVKFIHGDMTKKKVHDEILEKNNFEKFDLVLSDMCPEFTGTKVTDHTNLIHLNEITVEFAKKVLKRNGNLILKTFEGTLQKKLQEGIKKYFNKINRFKPASSRAESSELYIVCVGYLENEELKKEAEQLSKLSAKEYFEQEKHKSLRKYNLAKFNKLTLLEDLDKMKEEIIKKFQVDPEKIKIDPKEEEELKKIIEDENEKMNKELYGRNYKKSKATNLSEFIDEYEVEMKELNEKLKNALLKENINLDELDEFFKADETVEHLEELHRAEKKETEFAEKRLEALKNQIEKEDQEEEIKSNLNENEILLKYKRWEKILDEIDRDERIKTREDVNLEEEQQRNERAAYEDQVFTDGIQNLRKNVKKTIKKKGAAVASEDMFWKIANKKKE